MSADARDTASLKDEVSEAFDSLAPSDRGDFQYFVETFVSRRRFDDADLLTPAELVHAALGLWRASGERVPGTPLLRIGDSEGSRSGRTVIQIVTDDMPFLTDSILGELDALGLRIEAVLHPVIEIVRDDKGQRLGCVGSAGRDKRRAGKAVRESLLHIEVAQVEGAETLLEERLLSLLDEVRTIVSDFHPMTERLQETVKDLQRNCPLKDKDELAEIVEFLTWLADDHFAFLGVREYRVLGDGEMTDLEMVDGAGLGILRDPDMMVLRRGTEMVALTPEVKAFLQSPTPMIVTKANVRSRVHRRAHMDYVGVKLYSKKGDLVGERRFVGLFTAAAYNRNTREIPLLRRKVRRVVEEAGVLGGYDERALMNILETFPRDELFQVPEEDLLATALGILKLTKRPRASYFARRDPFDRFVSVLVFVPRERYGTAVRARIGETLARAFNGAISTYYPAFGDAPLARVHYIVRRGEGPCPEVDRAALEAEIEAITRDWRDELDRILAAQAGGRGLGVAPRYAQAFSAGYRETYLPDEAVRDTVEIERLLTSSDGEFAIRSYRRAEDGPDYLRVKLYRAGAPIILSDAIPVFERMGLRVIEEASHEVTPRVDIGAGRTEVRPFWIQELRMAQCDSLVIDLEKVGPAFESAFLDIWSGRVESDGFNQLVLTEGLAAREIVIIRTLARYLRQTAIPFSLDYMETGLASHPRIAGLLVRLFAARFDPLLAEPREELSGRLVQQILDALDEVTSADEDRIVRRMMNVVLATQRTNFYQRDEDGAQKPYLALKIRSGEVEELPLPRPHAEIFVYSPRVEGVHLRFGKVARGGLRWSDRREDFRTEVLGLVKAQQVKNAVIVPVGAKGGFVPKQLPDGGTREEIQAEAIASYQSFINGLLDLTDNYAGSGLVRPADTVLHDDEDPYLVVAADKGTATFSDIANALAVERGFWLGDAFASGGSQGYDHKKMGITARGAWEAVKRHFREMGRDIQREPFTASGVGDMSGDVFGNGMLLSRQTRLVAAFDHRDIFLDPSPDTEKSYKERKRLFETPRSSWQDYAKNVLSKGGGVFSRRAKLVELSPEAQALLGVAESALPPNKVIQAILQLDVDLLWFGGIGTYVKDESESAFDVGDRANDAIRVDASAVRAKVIGEGANLGFTQLARIAYARKGGRINTDAIDNSAGVDSSDHEVNLKILLDSAVASGSLPIPARNALLEEMTEEVASLVLDNNYEQTLALSLAEARAAEDLDAHGRFMRRLERDGRLDRHVEFLPDEEGLRELSEAGLGLTRPEIAVLFAYAKIAVFDAVVASDVPDDPYLDADLEAYFPNRLHTPYRSAIRAHRLRRELVATILANDAVNMGGLTFVPRIAETAGVDAPAVLRAHVITRNVFGLAELHDRINTLDLEIPSPLQIELHQHVRGFLRRQVLWFLRTDPEALEIGRFVEAYAPGVAELGGRCEDWLTGLDLAACSELKARYAGAGVPQDVASQVADLLPLQSGCDVIDISSHWAMPLMETARAYSEIGAALGLDRLRAAAGALHGAEHWERLANRRLLEDMFRLQRALAHAAIGQAILEGGTGLEGPAIVERWAEVHETSVRRTVGLVTELESAGQWTTAKLSLAVQQFRDLVEGPAGRDDTNRGAEA